jgi:hypothetical protein
MWSVTYDMLHRKYYHAYYQHLNVSLHISIIYSAWHTFTALTVGINPRSSKSPYKAVPRVTASCLTLLMDIWMKLGLYLTKHPVFIITMTMNGSVLACSTLVADS